MSEQFNVDRVLSAVNNPSSVFSAYSLSIQKMESTIAMAERAVRVFPIKSIASTAMVVPTKLPNINATWKAVITEIENSDIVLAPSANYLNRLLADMNYISSAQVHSLSMLASDDFVKQFSLDLKQAFPLAGDQQLNDAIGAAQSLSNGASEINWNILENKVDKPEYTTGIDKGSLGENVYIHREHAKLQLFVLQTKEWVIWFWDKSKDVKENTENAVFWLFVLQQLFKWMCSLHR